jgi:hypothetical protein
MLTGARPARDDFPPEPRASLNAPLLLSGKTFDATELDGLRRAISAFAARIAGDALATSGCATTAQSQRDCLAAWASRLAERAWRRPVRSNEILRLQEIVRFAGSTAEDDRATVTSALEALFLSPSFLYRTERGTPIAGSAGLRRLDAMEIATRLSFFSTLAPPDPELMAAAAAGLLEDPAERAQQLDRLSLTPRGSRALAVIVLEWLTANDPHLREKAVRSVAGLPADAEFQLQASAETTVRRVISGPSPTLRTLLTTNVYLDDPVVQKIRQPTVEGSGDVAETGRAGLLMHPQILAAHTKEDGASPFRMGKFLRETLLCEPVPEPPPDAEALAAQGEPLGVGVPTIRQELEYKTSGSTCKACHGLFAPLGYAFLPFDPVGRWMQRDPSGQAWDLGGTVETHSGPLSFVSPSDLTAKLAGSPQVQACFAQAMLQWALGRQLAEGDEGLVAAIEREVRRAPGDIPAVFRAIVSAPEFATVVAGR